GPSSYFEPTFTETAPGLLLPILLSVGQFEMLLQRLPEGFNGYRGWYSFTDPARLTRGTVSRALAEVDELDDLVAAEEGVAFSPMGNTVREFERDADHQRAPLTILLLEIAAIALFYLVLVSSAVLDRQAREISLLRSRGTSAGQVLLSFLFEALIIGVAATILAPFVAAGIVALLGLTPIFEGVTDGDPLDVTLLPSAFLFAAGGALLGVLALMAPAAIAARRGIVSQRQAEARPSKPFFQRYFLDVAFVAIALLLLWELNERGSVYEPSSTGGVSSDPLLLASPALIVFAGALIFLRFYPIVLRGLGWLALRGPGVSPGMGISTLVRRPGQYGQLALLLLMAVAVGTFAASYSATTDRSLEDRAAFESGVEFRSGSPDGAMGNIGPRTDSSLAGLPYQDTATAVMRTEASISLSGSGGRSLQLLAIDPAVAGGMLWFRDDFADSSLDGVLGPLESGDSLPGIEVPGAPVSFSAWVYLPEPRDGTSIWARFEDAGGNSPLVDLGDLEFTGWQELTAPLESPTGELTAPVRLTAIILSSPPTRGIV
ncbi:MAG: FtsX-like permease family protein, partial [Tepidiformaceae bacterium]